MLPARRIAFGPLAAVISGIGWGRRVIELAVDRIVFAAMRDRSPGPWAADDFDGFHQPIPGSQFGQSPVAACSFNASPDPTPRNIRRG